MMMHHDELLQQRELDGVLPRDQSAALAVLTADRSALAQQSIKLQALDADLRSLALTVRTRGQQANHDVALRAAIMERVSQRMPATHVRVRPLDLIYATSAAMLALATYGLAGAAVRTLFEQAVVMTWAIGISLTMGLLLLIAPGFLRRAESGMLGTILRRPIAIGPADVLVYRAVGVALVVGGIWLTY